MVITPPPPPNYSFLPYIHILTIHACVSRYISKRRRCNSILLFLFYCFSLTGTALTYNNHCFVLLASFQLYKAIIHKALLAFGKAYLKYQNRGKKIDAQRKKCKIDSYLHLRRYFFHFLVNHSTVLKIRNCYPATVSRYFNIVLLFLYSRPILHVYTYPPLSYSLRETL